MSFFSPFNFLKRLDEQLLQSKPIIWNTKVIYFLVYAVLGSVIAVLAALFVTSNYSWVLTPLASSTIDSCRLLLLVGCCAISTYYIATQRLKELSLTSFYLHVFSGFLLFLPFLLFSFVYQERIADIGEQEDFKKITSEILKEYRYYTANGNEEKQRMYLVRKDSIDKDSSEFIAFFYNGISSELKTSTRIITKILSQDQIQFYEDSVLYYKDSLPGNLFNLIFKDTFLLHDPLPNYGFVVSDSSKKEQKILSKYGFKVSDLIFEDPRYILGKDYPRFYFISRGQSDIGEFNYPLEKVKTMSNGNYMKGCWLLLAIAFLVPFSLSLINNADLLNWLNTNLSIFFISLNGFIGITLLSENLVSLPYFMVNKNILIGFILTMLVLLIFSSFYRFLNSSLFGHIYFSIYGFSISLLNYHYWYTYVMKEELNVVFYVLAFLVLYSLFMVYLIRQDAEPKLV